MRKIVGEIEFWSLETYLGEGKSRNSKREVTFLENVECLK